MNTILLYVFIGLCLLGEVRLEAQTNRETTDVNKKQDSKTKEALETVQGFLQALRDHDVNKAYYAFTSQDFRSATPRQEFQTFIFDNSVLSKNQTADFRDPVFQNNMVIFQGTLVSIDLNKNVVEFALKIENGQWRILGIKVFPASK